MFVLGGVLIFAFGLGLFAVGLIFYFVTQPVLVIPWWIWGLLLAGLVVTVIGGIWLSLAIGCPRQTVLVAG